MSQCMIKIFFPLMIKKIQQERKYNEKKRINSFKLYITIMKTNWESYDSSIHSIFSDFKHNLDMKTKSNPFQTNR